jgi:predicted DNA-binding transcriptional regulator AlpA
MTMKSLRLVGTHEIRELLGGTLARQRIYQITSRKDFPDPYATLAQGKLWLTGDVELWIREHRPSAVKNIQARRSLRTRRRTRP